MSYLTCTICGRSRMPSRGRPCLHCDRPCGLSTCIICKAIQNGTLAADSALGDTPSSGRPYRWDDDGPEEPTLT